MLANYFPILIFIGIGLFIGVVALTMSVILGPRRPNKAKNSPYECGFEADGHARMPFDVRFYLVALLFILFDLETAFLVPWALVFRKLGWLPFGAMGVFLFLLLIGFVYEWKKGALEWE
jgi:NADH-quinone oxidoreductase subunit A